jgi:hypothetical protein
MSRYNTLMIKAPKLWILMIIGLGIAVVALAWFVMQARLTTGPTSSDAHLKEELGCDRITADYRETDPFCNNLPLYRQLKAKGLSFGASEDGGADTYTFALISTQTNKAVANTRITVAALQSVQCIQAPCPAQRQEVWAGSTDSLGLVRVPANKIPGSDSLVITAEGLESSSIMLRPDKPNYAVGLFADQTP